MSKQKPKLLVIAKTAPLFDRSGADARLFQILKELKNFYEIHFLATTHPVVNKKENLLYFPERDSNFHLERFHFPEIQYQKALQEIGIRVLQKPLPELLTIRPTHQFDIRPFLRKENYDAIWVEYFYLADRYLADIRQYQPTASIIVDSVDLHYLRLRRQAEFLQNNVRYTINKKHEKKSLRKDHKNKIRDHFFYSEQVRLAEVTLYEKCDLVIASSEDDFHTLQQENSRSAPLIIGRAFPQQKFSSSFEQRENIVFFGNFDNNTNISSAIFLKHEVLPHLDKVDPKAKLLIIGNNPPKLIQSMPLFGEHKERIQLLGHSRDLSHPLSQGRVCAAPIFFASGTLGKIGDALAHGIPVVTTPLGAKLFGLTHEVNCLVAEEGEAFAHAMALLYQDKEVWQRIRDGGTRYIERFSSITTQVEKLVERLQKLQQKTKPLAPVKTKPGSHLKLPQKIIFKKEPNDIDISVILLTYNAWHATELCLKSLMLSQQQSKKLRIEFLVVDNASSDQTAANLQKIPGINFIRNTENLGFAAGNNIGIQAARGKAIVLLNNDTVVAPDWLERFHEHAKRIPRLGVLGPCTNTETGQSLVGARYNSYPEFVEYTSKVTRDFAGAWEPVRKISGLCLYIPRTTLDKIGLLDEGFGIGYFEDDDYCLRVEKAGLRVILAKDTYVHHFGSVSFEQNRMKRNHFLAEGMSHFVFKWGRPGLEYIRQIHGDNFLKAKKQTYF